MSTDAQLRDQALAELQQTTRGLHGYTPTPGSHWQKALALLAQIDATKELFGNAGETMEPSGAGSPLPWQKLDGDDLLDLTDPFNPTVIADGEYAFAIDIELGGLPNGMTAFRGQLILDTAAANPALIEGNAAVGAAGGILSLTEMWVLKAGAVVRAVVTFDDASDARPFYLSGSVAKIK